MDLLLEPDKENLQKIIPVCPVFGACGGCFYQDIPYLNELGLKEKIVQALFLENLKIGPDVFDPIVGSPQEYHYRNRLDLKLVKNRQGEIEIGFSPHGRHRLIPVEACPIARHEISDFIPELKRQAREKLPSTYNLANLVVRCGDDKNVHWGGIGRRSLRLNETEYFFTEIRGRKIFYSLDTFFQANLSILPQLFERIANLDIWNPETVLFDLYGGVGLFSVGLIDLVERSILIEESNTSIRMAIFNKGFHHLDQLEIIEGKVEAHWEGLQTAFAGKRKVAFIDPPRCGLSKDALLIIKESSQLDAFLYLSCHPETLVRDLKVLLACGWTIQRVMPFDFFPKTRHVETLVLLKAPA